MNLEHILNLTERSDRMFTFLDLFAGFPGEGCAIFWFILFSLCTLATVDDAKRKGEYTVSIFLGALWGLMFGSLVLLTMMAFATRGAVGSLIWETIKSLNVTIFWIWLGANLYPMFANTNTPAPTNPNSNPPPTQ